MSDPRALTLVQEDRPLDFNRIIEAQGGQVDLSGGQFRGYDLRKFNLQKANLENAYLRNADLRGLDLTQTRMRGASIKDAHVSGTMFPLDIPAQELLLSLEHGTRLRQP